ncbi:MAG: tetratricopeptide repeat protein [bacterium]|nr:tetratricopeptide repeat protein [bacterium]
MEDTHISFEEKSYRASSGDAPEGMSDSLSGFRGRFLRSFSWDQIARIFIYIAVGLLPMWALPFTVFPIVLNKAFLFSVFVLLAFISWLIGRIQQGELSIPKHIFAAALIGYVVVNLISGLFSVSRHVSFIGLGNEPDTVVASVLFVLGAFIMSFLFRGKNDSRTLFLVLGASSLALFVLQLVHMFGGFNFWGSAFTVPSANPIGSWNAFGLYWSFLGFLFLFLAKNDEGKYVSLFYYAVSCAALVMMIAVNFKMAWILYAVFTVILFAYLYSFKRSKPTLHWEPLAFLLVALFFLVTPVLGQSVSAIFGGDIVEVRPSWDASWSVTQLTLREGNLFFGSGPNTFLYDWLLYKPLEVNQTVFWATRFTTGVSFLSTLFATLGLAGALSLLLLIGSVLFYGIRAIVRFAFEGGHTFSVVTFLGVLYLLLGLILYTPGYFFVLFFFLFLGLFIAQMSSAGILSDYRIPLFQNAGVGFVAALLLLCLSVASIAGVYLLGQKYVAAIYYGNGIAHINEENDTEAARNDFVRAINLDQRDRYLRSLVDVDLIRMNALLTRTDISIDEARSQFQTILAGAVQTGQLASQINPGETLNWITLGRVYESVIPFNIEGAAGFASDMYERAHERSPQSPEALFVRARANVQVGEFDDAESLLEQAIGIKTDYAPARFLLAQIKAQTGDINSAIEETRNTQFLLPNDIGVLFQLGLLYYQSDQFENARQVFERAIELNPNYSNARYFLGIIYDRQGDKDAAMIQFERVEELNPSVQEVKQILSNLRGGKQALEGIPPPEDRETSPLEE